MLTIHLSSVFFNITILLYQYFSSLKVSLFIFGLICFLFLIQFLDVLVESLLLLDYIFPHFFHSFYFGLIVLLFDADESVEPGLFFFHLGIEVLHDVRPREPCLFGYRDLVAARSLKLASSLKRIHTAYLA